MKKFRKGILKNIFVFTIAFNILLISCTSEGANSNSINDSKTNLTGEDFFNAIYFKRGPLVNEIYKNELSIFKKEKKYADINISEINSFQDKVFNEIKKNNPDFINDFEKSIKSNNIKNIESAVNKGAKLVFKTLIFLKNDSSLKENKIF